MDGLFRMEALQAHRVQRLGAIDLAMPLSFGWQALLVLVMTAAIIACWLSANTPVAKPSRASCCPAPACSR
jgi:hypothetical protein